MNNSNLPEGNKISRRTVIISHKSKAQMQRTWAHKLADALAHDLGTITFFILNAIAFTTWIFFNAGIIEGITPFDPFPFSFLTTAVSLEAILLSIIVLISQNRAAKSDQLRQELDLQLDLISEQEITKIMEMLAKIMESHKIDISGDKELMQMLKPTNTQKIEEEIEEELKK